MTSLNDAAAFHRDPLAFLDESLRAQPDAFWIPGRQLLVGEPDLAKAVLRNASGLYRERADFFRLRSGGTFGDRPVQQRMGRAARDLLRSHAVARAGSLGTRIQERLGAESEWPDAGNWLLFDLFRDALLAPHRPAPLRAILESIVRRAVLAGAHRRHSWLSRALFRRRAYRELARELALSRRETDAPPRDLLDVVAREAGPGADLSELAEVYVSFVFAATGSIGFVLGWSLYLLGTVGSEAGSRQLETSPASDVPPAWIVREALRLWPVAWMLGSRPARDHQVAGVEVTPGDEVVACPYLAHRHSAHWEEPERFRPERWADRRRPRGFLPFGWGPHKCPAATLSTDLAAELLGSILAVSRPRVSPRESRPQVGAALAPPRFLLTLEPAPSAPSAGSDRPLKGGDSHGQDRSCRPRGALHPA